MDGLDFYDLQPLSIWGPRSINYTDSKTGATMSLSFCQDLPESMYCNSSEPTMAVLHDPFGKCVKLSGPDPTKNAKLKELGDGQKDVGVTVDYLGGDPNYKLIISIVCSKENFVMGGVTVSQVNETTQIIATFESRVGCKYD